MNVVTTGPDSWPGSGFALRSELLKSLLNIEIWLQLLLIFILLSFIFSILITTFVVMLVASFMPKRSIARDMQAILKTTMVKTILTVSAKTISVFVDLLIGDVTATGDAALLMLIVSVGARMGYLEWRLVWAVGMSYLGVCYASRQFGGPQQDKIEMGDQEEERRLLISIL